MREKIGMNDGVRIRQMLIRLMMIRQNDLHSERLCQRDFLDCRNAAVDCDDEIDLPLFQFPDRIAVQAVTVLQTIGNEEDRAVRIGALILKTQTFEEDRRGSHPVHIIVAVNRDLFPLTYSPNDQFRSPCTSVKQIRFVKMNESWIQMPHRLIGSTNTAGNEKFCENWRQTGIPHNVRDRGEVALTGPKTPAFCLMFCHDSHPEEPSRKRKTGNAILTADGSIPFPVTQKGKIYFFFSLCMVCLRSQGQNFLIFSFSLPGLRRRT